MKRSGMILVSLMASLMISCASGEAKVKPVAVDPEAIDLANGSFDIQVANMDSFDQDRALTFELYESDRYNPEEIRALAPGDTLLINGQEYTVEEVGIRDASWPGDEPETVYDISTVEECWDGIWFSETSSGISAHVGDWNPVTYIATVTIPLPLPASFVYYDYPGGEEAKIGSEKEFLQDLRDHSPEFFNPYNTWASFKDGELAEVHNFSYPWGPSESALTDDEIDAAYGEDDV